MFFPISQRIIFHVPSIAVCFQTSFWSSSYRRARFNSIRIEKLNVEGLLPSERKINMMEYRRICIENWEVSAVDASFRNSEDFMAGSLSMCADFWEHEILKSHPRKEEILSWIKYGVRIEPFLSPFTKGSYYGRVLASTKPQFYREHNHVSPEFESWVDSEIQQLLKWQVLKKWDKNIMNEPFPVVIAPLLVEPSKPRLIYDARYVNAFLSLPSTEMKGLGLVPTCFWKGMYMVTIDHKSGYHHVPLHDSAWTYFGVQWNNEVFCFTTLSFGWSPSAYIYCSLTDAVSSFVRSVTSSPVIDWVDDTATGTSIMFRNGSASAQFQSANRTAFTTAAILFLAGYFVNIPKSNFLPKKVIEFLGMRIDSDRAMFFVPEKKVLKLTTTIQEVLANGHLSLTQLESIVGKCRNMVIAVPCAVLYTRVQYAELSKSLTLEGSLRRDRKKIKISISQQLRDELVFWLGLKQALLNGAQWAGTSHIGVTLLSHEAHIDASSRRWGGTLVASCEDFKVAEDFNEEDVTRHINEKETLAFHRFLHNFLPSHEELVRNKRLLVHTDNQVLYYVFHSQGTSGNLFITDVLKKVFWLLFSFRCTVDLRWIPTDKNWADPLTRSHLLEDLRLSRKCFLFLWKKFGPIGFDLMASSTNVQKDIEGFPLPYFSQYALQGSYAVDVFSQNIGEQLRSEGLPFCFPPFSMIDLFLAHLLECRGRCLMVLPEFHGPWFPKFLLGRVSSSVVKLSSPNRKGVLLTFKRNSFVPFISKYAMIAAIVDFSY